MTQAAMTLWLAIDMLVTQIPFSKAKVESALLTQLSDTKAPGSEVFQFFEGTPVRFEDGVEASKFDLRIKRECAHPGFLVLEVQGRCVPLDEVKPGNKITAQLKRLVLAQDAAKAESKSLPLLKKLKLATAR